MATQTNPIAIDPQLTPAQPAEYLYELLRGRHQPVLVLEREPLTAALQAVGGAKGLAVPDVFEPYQIGNLPLYIGATTPQATHEVPHWHPDQAEAYVVLNGEAELLAKYRWEDNAWVKKVGGAGDVLIVQPEACHWFRWRSAGGLALVFKAPQRAGLGPFPNGKVTCAHCPHFNRGCVMPDTFQVIPEPDRVAK